ncbi:NADPH:adrenodoxin oxidoreductase, mitochondrial [Galendromus occidentalis]|uniref:NADPH:adrenodoxin oxidoreductase, mitochondrial n=1 Tax=Galendromus occidentalis TaxID=34638 RepID=A0AAJ7L657_9ACAR|nr:NADPH:adrenodoxin oxidoreductase, mitochondrial [Galendromus occidentalis]
MASQFYMRQFTGSRIARLFSSSSTLPQNSNVKVCVVGAGAAGFYTAQQILKAPNTQVDIYESLPVPFGLVRYGVAPDHPEVKNCINTFTAVAKNPRCRYYGNVKLGSDVTFKQFRDAYHAIVLTYGADNERTLGVPGENLKYVLSARQFVNWYNGHPSRIITEDINFDADHCAIVGHGNVALDVARILLAPIDKLKTTDITEEALDALSRSRIKRVSLIGRRGPLQVAFTIKEFRELVKLEGVGSLLDANDFVGIDTSKMQRPRKRLTELMLQTLERNVSAASPAASKVWDLKFLRSPLEFLGDQSNKERVVSIRLAVNRLEDERAVPTGIEETLPTGLAIKSVGYSSSCPDNDIPFDARRGIIENDAGRVRGLPGVYCSGWVKTGPIGVIVSTMNGSFETGANLLDDLTNGVIDSVSPRGGSELIVHQILKSKGVRHVSFEQWEKIAAFETEMGSKKHKSADKVLSVDQMLKIAFS